MTKLFDTHTHLTDQRFDGDLEALLASLPQKGVARVVDVACHVRDAEKTLELANKYDFIYASVGMHPHEAAETAAHHLEEEARIIKANKKMVALGEIGLDYHYDFSPRPIQRKWFCEQLDLAQQLDVPVIFHIREAFGDCMDILRERRGRFRGVMHCYSGSMETAYECLDMGLYIAFGGAVTFHNAVKQADMAARLPLDRLVIETDCPYMTPAPFRGKRNDPSMARLVAEKIASLRGVSVESIASVTYENGISLFEMERD